MQLPDFSFNFGDDDEPTTANGQANVDTGKVNDSQTRPEDCVSESSTVESEATESDAVYLERGAGEPTDNLVDSPASNGEVNHPLTDDEVNRIFGEMVEWDKVDTETLNAAAAVINAEAVVAEAEIEYQHAQEESAHLRDEISELEKKLNELKRQKSEFDGKVWDIRTNLQRKSRDVEEKKRVAKAAYRDAQTIAEVELLSQQYERIAMAQPWWNGITNENGDVLKVMPHQWDAMRFMAAGKRILLGDGMGLGKSLEALGTIDITQSNRILILTPSDIAGNFVEEINFWTKGLPALSIKGQTKIGRNVLIDGMSMLKRFVIICNYEAWRRDHKLIEKFINVGFDTVICDEAHWLKETDTSVYKGVKEIIHAINRCPNDGTVLAYGKEECHVCHWRVGEHFDHQGKRWEDAYWDMRTAQRVIMMTGTFILNRPGDLFAPLSLIDPVFFRNKQEFLRQYAEWDYDKGQYVFGSGGLDSLKVKLSGRFLSRTLEDAGIKLPPQKPIIHEVELDEEHYAKQIQVIEQINKNAAIVLDENRSMSITAFIAILTRLRQANVWPGGISLKDPKTGVVIWAVGEEVQESVKLDKAAELIREFTAQGDRIVVFSQFSTALRELHARVNGSKNDNDELISSVVFDGSTPDDIRADVRRNFDKKLGEPKKWDVVLANYKTGGVGLNLTAATHTIILDREWNPGKEDQALARTHRIGQDETTFVHIITIPDTVDQWLDDIIERKRTMIQGFNDTADDLKEELLKKLRGRKK